MEQGRVNDAARVGQSTDLVLAPLFLLLFSSLSVAPVLVLLVYEPDFHRDLSVCL